MTYTKEQIEKLRELFGEAIDPVAKDGHIMIDVGKVPDEINIQDYVDSINNYVKEHYGK